MKPDVRATNQLLGCYMSLQNQLDSWTLTLEQTATFHDAVLTPRQKETVAVALIGCRRLHKRLQ